MYTLHKQYIYIYIHIHTYTYNYLPRPAAAKAFGDAVWDEFMVVFLYVQLLR